MASALDAPPTAGGGAIAKALSTPAGVLAPEDASLVVKLLVLAMQGQHLGVAVRALVELAHEAHDHGALRARARRAIAAALAECGIKTQLVPPPLPPEFRPPDPEELQRLLALTNLAFPAPLPTPIPVTGRATPDRHPYEGDPLVTFADLAIKSGRDAGAWVTAGLRCSWFSEICDELALEARATVGPHAVRVPHFSQRIPSEVRSACIVIANLASAPFALANLRMAQGKEQDSVEVLVFLHTLAVVRPKAAVLINLPQMASAANGRIAKLTCDLAAECGFRAEVHTPSAIDYGTPVDTKRTVVFFVREDFACKWGMPKFPPGAGACPNGLDGLLYPADEMTHLWLHQEVTWVCNPDSQLPDHAAVAPRLVGFVGSSSAAEFRVFTHAVPATKREPRGPGGLSHLIAQQSAGLKRWIVRPMSAAELDRLVTLGDPAPEPGLEPPEPSEQATADGARAVPGNLMRAIVKAMVSFFQPISTFRPQALADVGLTPSVIQQWQASMRVGHKDHLRMRRDGTCDLGSGITGSREGARPKRITRHMNPKDACFAVAAPREARNVVWFVADAVATNNPALIVPVQEWRKVSSHINREAVRRMAIGFPDKEIVDFIMFGTNAKNNPFTNQSALLPNAKSGEEGWFYVNKAFMEDLDQGVAVKFDVAHSPPFWPIVTHPTGAVEKTDAQGRALTDERRPTSDLSFKGSTVHDVIDAPNDSIDLEDKSQFPTLKYFSVTTLARKALVLSLAGVPVRAAAWDMKGYYKQFYAQMVTVGSHCRYWSNQEGAAVIASLTMLFGCKAAACIASRGSALLAYWLQTVMDILPPAHPKAKRWQDLQSWAVGQREAGDGRFAKFVPFRHSATCDHYIDDFPTLCQEGQEEPIKKAFAALMMETGFRPQPKKILSDGDFTPVKKILGVVLDMSKSPYELRIPEAKVLKALDKIAAVRRDAWTSHKQLEEMVGILNWIGSILAPSGCRLPFAINTLKAALRYGRARVSRELSDELDWWEDLLAKWNRRAVVLEPAWTIPAHAADHAPFTDASRSLKRGGAGGIFRHYFFAWSWSIEELEELNIMELEGLTHVLWLRWICNNLPGLVAGKRFMSRCDNMGFVDATKKGRSTVPSISFLLNQLHELQALFSFEIQLEFVASEDNTAADAASRQQWNRFYNFMRVNTNLTPDCLVQIHDVPMRSSWSLRMRQLKSSAQDTLRPQ
jgi:hypothetical protein